MFNFIIPSCVKNYLHSNQLFRCINSIRRFHLENIIYIINDSDDDMDYLYNDITSKYNNIFIIKSQYRNRGELLCLKFILDNDNNENYIVMHDSMLLLEPLINIESIKNIKFLWSFTNHILHWDNIIEDRTYYNITNNIYTHTDLLKDTIIKDYNMNSEFQKFAIDCLINKNKWCGCMGLCYITNKKTIKKMNDSLPFVEIFLKKNDRRNRVVNESIFSIICHFFYKEENFYNSYDGLYYDGVNNPNNSNVSLGEDNLFFVCKNKYIGKISFLR